VHSYRFDHLVSNLTLCDQGVGTFVVFLFFQNHPATFSFPLQALLVHKSYQNQIEQTQKRFLRYVYYKKYHISAYKNKVSYIKLLKEVNSVTVASRRDISEQAFLYKTVNGVLDNSAFLEQLNFNIRKGNQCTRHRFSYYIPKTVMCENSPLLRRYNI
jgi:hypothetical protein